MMKYFLASSLVFLCIGCASTAVVSRAAYEIPENSRLWTDEIRDNDNINRYQVSIKVKGNTITGMCMLKKSDEGWRGTLINEFGVKAFDFIVTPAKCELLNTIAMMNKWYIRNTIAGDLHFLFEVDNPEVRFQSKTVRNAEPNGTLTIDLKKKKSIVRNADNAVVMRNMKRNIVYSLNVITNDNGGL